MDDDPEDKSPAAFSAALTLAFLLAFRFFFDSAGPHEAEIAFAGLEPAVSVHAGHSGSQYSDVSGESGECISNLAVGVTPEVLRGTGAGVPRGNAAAS